MIRTMQDTQQIAQRVRPQSARPGSRPASSQPSRQQQHQEQPSPTSLAIALIREFLVARGLSKTLESFKNEIQEESPISSRAALASHLGIAKAVAANRTSEKPLDSYIEIFIQQVSTHTIKRPASAGSAASKPKYKATSASVSATTAAVGSLSISQQRLSASPSSPTSQVSPTSPIQPDQREKDKLSNNPKRQQSTMPTDAGESPAMAMIRESFSSRVSSPAFVSRPTLTQSSPGAYTATNRKPTPDIEIIDDFELSDDEDVNVTAHHTQHFINGPSASHWSKSQGTRISPHLAGELRRILFQSDQVRGRAWFGEEWRGKGFVFNDAIDLGYGIVQMKGGPCGLLAAVQAHVIKYLIESTYFSCIVAGRLRPTVPQTRAALIHAISEMAWRASGSQHRAIIVISTNGAQHETIADGFEYHTFNNLAAAKDFVEAHIGQFMQNDGSAHGIIQVLISLILSRGIDAIRKDMDDPECTLMGKHGYCTQDMVNLALYGEAISNVHDGDIHLGSGTILKGIKNTVPIGQLSLFEHYNSMRVGDIAKTPTAPVFVVCSESHYTVLFAVVGPGHTNDTLSPFMSVFGCNEIPSGLRFDLFYYDGLSNQPHEIRLTISAMTPSSPRRTPKDDLVPPLEHCIRTKWTNASVNWNETEPLL